MIGRLVITILEYLLIGVSALLITLGYADHGASNVDTLYWITVLLVSAVLFMGLTASSGRSATLKILFGSAVLAMAGAHLSGWPIDKGMPFVYFMVMIAAGAFGDILTVIALFFLFTIGEFGSRFIPALTINSNDTSLLRTILISSIPLWVSELYLILSGLLPVAAVKKFREQEKSSTPVPVQKSSKKTVAAQEPTTQMSDSALTQTSMFKVEYVSEMMGRVEVDELLSSVVYFMSKNFRAYSALGFVYDPVRKTFTLNSTHSKSLNIVKGKEFPLGTGVIGKIGTEKRSFMSGDLSFYRSEVGYYGSAEFVNSILAVPIISEEQELLGVLVIDSKDKNAFKDQDKETLKRFSNLAAALITNARMRIFQERAARTSQIFYQASHQFTTAMSFDEVFDVLFRMVPMIAPVTRTMGILLNEEHRRGVVHKIDGNSPDVALGFEFPINNGLYSYAFQKRRIITIPDFHQYEQRYFRFVPDETKNPSIRSLTIFPITDDECRCAALFSIESDQPNFFSGEIEQTLATLVDNASVAFTRALLYKRMEKLATTDGLTELFNHRQFQDVLAKEMERSRRYKRPISLLLMDIDHFKTFNDTYGHPVGDLVLKEISSCIRKSIRINDIPARYGGEEFTVIIPETDEKGALVIAERIRSTIENHIIISLGRELRVNVSIGCCGFPNLAQTQQEIIENADKALYFSKENGRNRVTLYKPGMGGKQKGKPCGH